MEKIYKMLEKVGLQEKDIKVYLSLLELGPSPIRKIADKSGINRGTTHGTLKHLLSLGLVSYYHKEKNQYFIAEDPKNIEKIIRNKKDEIDESLSEFENILPKLYNLGNSTEKSVVKFYEGYVGIKNILEDALISVEKDFKKEYVVFSSSSISPFLYHPKAFPNFTEERIKRNISVRTIGSGPSGSLQGKDQRKWLTKKESSPTYKLIYAGKVAIISNGKDNIPHGIIIEDKSVYLSELQVFDALWKLL